MLCFEKITKFVASLTLLALLAGCTTSQTIAARHGPRAVTFKGEEMIMVPLLINGRKFSDLMFPPGMSAKDIELAARDIAFKDGPKAGQEPKEVIVMEQGIVNVIY